LGGALAVLLAAAVPTRGEPDASSTLIVAPGLLSKLQVLANGLQTEIVLCLHGSVAGDTAIATEFSMPEPRVSTFQRSAFLPCPPETLGSWHNHPLIEFHAPGTPTAGGTAAPQTIRPLELCALSGKDIETADRMGYDFAVVAVDAATWCWWTRAQVQRFVRRRASQGGYLRGQVHVASDP
jgi:hypothetical protein